MDIREQIKECPKCKSMIYRENDTLRCLSNECDWEVPARRINDKEVPTWAELKDMWA